jgi:hypothetical protein
MPVFFILYDAPGRRAYWLYTQAYFVAHPPRTSKAQSLTLKVPKKNVLKRGTIERMRKYKAARYQQVRQGPTHHE